MADIPKLKRVQRLDAIKLDAYDKTYFTDEGYLVDHPILTSVGIFEYINADGSVRRELRLPEHVFAEESLKSYKGKPIIVTHDAGEVDKDNVSEEIIGTILSDGYQDGNDLRAEIIIHDTDTMKLCGLKELSLGYNLDLIEQSGTWEGQPYDAIQTNIVINHLALVSAARAGEQARLNIDGKEPETLKGGKCKMESNNKDEVAVLTPEQLQEAIAMYMESKGAEAEPQKPTTPADIAAQVKDRKDKRSADADPTETIAQQDKDIDMLLAAIDKLLSDNTDESETPTEPTEETVAEEPTKENADEFPPKEEEAEENKDGCKEDNADECAKEDSAENQSQSLNADSADDVKEDIKEKLKVCRVGDKLHLDGLEDKTILEAKKEIIKKVSPNMNLDGKSKAYIDAAYDMAVSDIDKPKNADYQREQMSNGAKRLDNNNNTSMAMSARQRMIARADKEEE